LWGHDSAGAGVAEKSLDAETSAEGGSAASAHVQIRHLQSGFAGRRFTLEQSQEGIGTGVGHLIGRRVQERLLRIHDDLHLSQTGAQIGQTCERLAQVFEGGAQKMLPGGLDRRPGNPDRHGGAADLEPRQGRAHSPSLLNR
jgi:hypothetical protein